MQDYDPKRIEEKWQKIWKEKGTHNPDLDKEPKPFYNLMMFPYPSAEGLHAGNMYAFTGADIYGRFQRMRGQNVFEPIGLDGFGIHSENYALKINAHPMDLAKVTEERFYKQLESIGNAYAWDSKLETYDPEYYKWTQWIFTKLYERDLAYKKTALVNWCPFDLTVLADEQVIAGKCERCGHEVEKKELEQWFFKITDYAERLLSNLDDLDWSERVKIAQRNWIGKSEGAIIKFQITSSTSEIEVFTTRPDTIFGATFLAVAPEVAKKLCGSDFGIVTATEQENKEKLGADTGLRAINPATKQEIPVWVANYVSAEYGTGAIMAVPSDDERDKEFAEKFGLPIADSYPKAGFEDFGKKKTTYRLRDWLISRQRYWGPPIPIIYCEKCGAVPVPEKDLPVVLPYVKDFRPSGMGQSPLAGVPEFTKTTCPKCGGEARRETDVSDTFLDSSWYFFRYLDVQNTEEAFDPDRVKKWLPVDMYIGGAEHSVLHLLYTRFITMVFKDMGLVDFEEPFKKFRAHGLIIRDGAKMSKSKGNVVNPDEYIRRFGADVLRTYLMFLAPFQEGGDFRDDGIAGIVRFFERAWKLVTENNFSISPSAELDQLVHQTVAKITEDIEQLHYNTCVSSLMMLLNAMHKDKPDAASVKTFLKLLNPFAPHLAHELWERMGEENILDMEPWPTFDEQKLVKTLYNMAVQVNGKLRATLEISASANEGEVKSAALALQEIEKWLNGATPKKVIIVLGRVVNIVV